MREILTRDWNLSILLSLLSAVVFGQVMSRDGYRHYSGLFPEAGSFQFTMFLVGGVAQSWVNMLGALANQDYTVPSVSLGLLLWVVGLVTQAARWSGADTGTPQEIVDHYIASTYVDTYLVSFGGGILFWTAFCNLAQLAFTFSAALWVKRALLAVFAVAVSAYGFFTASFRAYEVGRSPDVFTFTTFLVALPSLYMLWYTFVPVLTGDHTVAPAEAKRSGNPKKRPSGSGSTRDGEWRLAMVLHMIFVLLNACLIYLPYGFLGFYAATRGFDSDETMTVQLVFSAGCLVGALAVLESVDLTGEDVSRAVARIVLLAAAVVQAIVISVWAAMGGKDVPGLCAVAFFIGVSTIAVLLGSLMRTSRAFYVAPVFVALLHALHVALLVPGSTYTTQIMRSGPISESLTTLSIWGWFSAALAVLSCAVA